MSKVLKKFEAREIIKPFSFKYRSEYVNYIDLVSGIIYNERVSEIIIDGKESIPNSEIFLSDFISESQGFLRPLEFKKIIIQNVEATNLNFMENKISKIIFKKSNIFNIKLGTRVKTKLIFDYCEYNSIINILSNFEEKNIKSIEICDTLVHPTLIYFLSNFPKTSIITIGCVDIYRKDYFYKYQSEEDILTLF